MDAKQDIAMNPANCPASSVDTSTTQREKNLRSFKAKYDAMLYIVEFIATFHLRNIRNPRQAKKMADLKSMVVQTRNGLSACPPQKH